MYKWQYGDPVPAGQGLEFVRTQNPSYKSASGSPLHTGNHTHHSVFDPAKAWPSKSAEERDVLIRAMLATGELHVGLRALNT